MDDLTIAVSRKDYDTILTALDVTAARYQKLSETDPRMANRAEETRAAYERLYRYQRALANAEPPPTA